MLWQHYRHTCCVPYADFFSVADMAAVFRKCADDMPLLYASLYDFVNPNPEFGSFEYIVLHHTTNIIRFYSLSEIQSAMLDVARTLE